MESDYRVPTALGTAAWTATLIALVAMGDGLAEQDRWWRWVCLTGAALGAFGFLYIPRHLRRNPESEARRAADAPDAIAPRDTPRQETAEAGEDRGDAGGKPAGDASAARAPDGDPGGRPDGDPDGDRR